MRHFTLASLAATALTLGLLTATPSMAQTPAPATGGKMAPGAKMAPAEKMAPAPKAELLDINSATADQLEGLEGHRQGLFGQDHRGPSVQGQGRTGAEEHRAGEDL